MLVFTRTACLGGWVIEKKIGGHHEFYNQQKVRADVFFDLINGNLKKPIVSEIKKWLERNDLDELFNQQEKLYWTIIDKKPDLIIMDSYAELTEQKFIHKDGWGFCAHYSDLKNFENELTCYGLLDSNLIESVYDKFFKFIRSKWDSPMIFIHFPTTFESRERYKIQGDAITEALKNLSAKYNIQNIHADFESIEQKDSDTYHFTDKTVLNIANKIMLK